MANCDVVKPRYNFKCINTCMCPVSLISGNMFHCIKRSNRKAINRNWSNQKATPALKIKAGNK